MSYGQKLAKVIIADHSIIQRLRPCGLLENFSIAMNYIKTVPRIFPESFMVISSVGSEIWARVHTSGSSNTQYQVHGEKYISRTRFFPDMRFSQDVSRYFVLSISAIKSAYFMVKFSAKCQKPHFLAHICNFWMIQNFWPKKGSVSFFLLSISNFMQKIRMISWPVFEKKWWRTNGLTN